MSRVAGGPGAPQQNVQIRVCLFLLCFDGHRNKQVPLSHWDPSWLTRILGMKKTEESLLGLSSVTMLGCMGFNFNSFVPQESPPWWGWPEGDDAVCRWRRKRQEEDAGPLVQVPTAPSSLRAWLLGGPLPPFGHLTYLPRRLQVLCLLMSLPGSILQPPVEGFFFFLFFFKEVAVSRLKTKMLQEPWLSPGWGSSPT